ncbi:hypothetical protein A2230_00380 [candidate division WOR-1 bacterium RIFOXYA2_FULL_36_21]|uniref:Glycosyltransferase 2-like domain-containing protein n=1 Tax=candidate division WOR-1 bacterium RIFOXYB2_FULL_36_35 TaxID=1802578 RepID=A0A1F4S5B2_UNCSA|nr:MAG: hypothetical protein A2230_00380 [candidate division WOR-1 bacterium RIFOXYA2_FULL_36_21]OGC15625.1 MAG: hypothetical protein A2290_06080 [candidate division WOR-1 bacterium RIFOXYB2_FULL_36_35]OGC16373.1 MAG: hypothetical protein A2282_00425 [candidate division WOR-1 bacterium RIFOXYA12_FULL_36_13]
MTEELLSISIPTRNRSIYLKELLESIKINLKELIKAEGCQKVGVYVYDNDSDDSTKEIVDSAGFEICYEKHEKDIGGDPNIFHAYTKPKGKYIWVIGDDELIPPNMLTYLLDLIKKYEPGLIVNKSIEYNTLVKIPHYFKNYKEFCLFAEKNNPHLLIAHSLISANIIRKDCFNKEIALKMIKQNYGHFYGMIDGLYQTDASITFAQAPTLIVRDTRATQDAPEPEYVARLEMNQINYLNWLKNRYDLLSLQPERVNPDYSQRINWFNFKRKPFSFLAGYVYRFLFNLFPFMQPVLKSIINYYRLMRYGEPKC